MRHRGMIEMEARRPLLDSAPSESNTEASLSSSVAPLAAMDWRRAATQLPLMFNKDLLLMRRAKLWTFFEIVFPLLIMLPMVIVIIKSQNVEVKRAYAFEPVIVTGNIQDIDRPLGYIARISTHWGRKSDLNLGYFVRSGNTSDATSIMMELAERYSGETVTNGELHLRPTVFESEAAMEKTLRDDVHNETKFGSFIGKFVGGVVFDSIDVASRKLDYRMRIPTLRSEARQWHLDEVWDGGEPLAPTSDFGMIPNAPQYWTSGFISLQTALDTIFIERVTGAAPPNVVLQRVPEPASPQDSITTFLKFLPFLWGLFALPTVLHTTTKLANEIESGVKAFLSVMGLSRYVFFASHVLTGFLKMFIVVTICAVPLSTTISKTVSTSLFLVTVWLYSIGAIVFAAMSSTFFASSNTALKVCVLVWLGSVGLTWWSPPRTSIALCHLYSLNINAAFKYACQIIASYVNTDTPLGWLNAGTGGSSAFSLLSVVVMMFVDICWMAAVMYLLDHLSSSTDASWTNWFNVFSKKDVSGERSVAVTEPDSGLERERADIDIEGMVKMWGSGDYAVRGIDLKVFRGGVTVLLGHNGAGKSTTFSVISGQTPPTAGDVRICGHDIRSELSECQRHIGLCPQGNALFDKLTVMEHLKFFHKLKGAKTSTMAECKDIIAKVHLDEKKDTLSMNLSGGMKRKLCVGLALIGGSKVVLLDEPTAGMDPSARRDVEKLLAQEKRHRTILLTTHYMDEAETLGDRVAIMARGRLHAYGSIDFLKRTFGSGYILVVVVKDNVDTSKCAEAMLRLIQENFIATAGMESKGVHGKQFEIILPKDEADRFPPMLQYLEEHEEDLNMTSFGLSLNSLEQVFLKVEESVAESGRDSTDGSEDEDTAATTGRLSGLPFFFSQLRALFMKRFYYSRSNWTQLISQLLIPIALLFLVAYVSKLNFSSAMKDIVHPLTLQSLGNIRAPIQVLDDTHTLDSRIRTLLKESGGGVEIEEVAADKNLTQTLLDIGKQLPAIALGYQFKKDGVVSMFNSKAFHSIPVAINTLSNARMGDGRIAVSVQPYAAFSNSEKDPSAGPMFMSSVTDVLLGPLLILAFAMLTSSFAMFLVDERVCRFKHQQLLTRVSPITFWLGSLLFDLAVYAVACVVFALVFVVSGWMQGLMTDVVAVWALYFVAVVPFIYTCSYIFSSPSKANTLLVLWQIVAGFTALIAMFIVKSLELLAPWEYSMLQNALMCILPSYSMGNAMLTIGAESAQRGMIGQLNDGGVAMGSLGGDVWMWEWEKLGRPATMMAAFGCVASFLFVLLQFKSVRAAVVRVWDGHWNYRRVDSDEESRVDEDVDVRGERDRVMGSGADDVLQVKRLVKCYGKHAAVDHLTFGVDHRQCFGLLGVNGAGKTTTFNILTGVQFATSGSATIGGQDVTERVPIGYCPQLDAVMLDLTGRENVVTLARLHGLADAEGHADRVLRRVGMSQHADKPVRMCSGGQRRKLSVGVAVLAQSRMLILDEPTAGIDPKARRDIWDLLSAVRDSAVGSALLLTSHSMDECEALCSRIAVLNRGRLVAIGTAQHLKSIYGKNYSLTMNVPAETNEPSEKKEQMNAAVEKVFGKENVKLLTVGSASSVMKWQLVKQQSDRWSSVFSRVLSLKDSLGVSDFCLSQSSLEDTFLRLAEMESEN